MARGILHLHRYLRPSPHPLDCHEELRDGGVEGGEDAYRRVKVASLAVEKVGGNDIGVKGEVRRGDSDGSYRVAGDYAGLLGIRVWEDIFYNSDAKAIVSASCQLKELNEKAQRVVK